ncbi:hypothetical protein AWB78_07812 [Caballeronia calidae]|uniref:Uncharacterized protein n=1 Tax=Caballeronia calidae TaxID=1777139 RepID=A0A158EGN5_9BURK|nr:hypothetical protein [Caballeronia calidae]SAL05988.1 hypothetical protein AWB78_07812 [Caballeronia calidae]
MSAFARIAANRLRETQFALTEHERLSYATFLDVLSNEWGRCHACSHQMPQIIGNEHFRAGDDLKMDLPARLYRINNGEQE